MRGRRRSGDGFIACSCGRRHWGRFGAAGLLVVRGDTVLLQHRAEWSHEGGTWGVPGGALDADESPLQGALREAAEEAAVPASAVRPQHAWTVDHGTWRYTTVIAQAQAPFEPQRLDGESKELRWVSLRDVPALPLHGGFAAGWRTYGPLLERREVVVVDAANVVGSVPDGWWRDRAGAASRLVERITALAEQGVPGDAALLPEIPGRTAAWPHWVVVLEGQARGAAASSPLVTVVDAQVGDDEVVAAAARHGRRGHAVTVVSADRGLRARVAAVSRVVGPGTLRGLLPQPG
jgi:8-oxo-dGTP pyrophosphatase MutT (NUDIX family)